jgi:phytoene dehydrogenase-like protein
MSEPQADRKDLPQVTVVGAGIAGLYAAYLLALAGYPVEILEQNEKRCGGRIATRSYPKGTDPPFFAEFGPMRFELDLQDRFLQLCQHLGIGFRGFAKTGTPPIVTEYEMTAIERAFTNVAELHEWAVLKMFFGRKQDVLRKLADIEDEHPRSPKTIGQLQLQWLQCYMDERLFVSVNGKAITPRPEKEIEENLNRLRKNQRLFGGTGREFPLLRNLGLWQALSEVISPGALSKIRDSGTFYHLIADNPSAAEWGIFWLRQASALGELFTFEGVDNGISTLVDRLVCKLRDEQHVPIRTGKQVVQIEPAKRPSEVVLRILERDDRGRAGKSFNLRTDHAILALPQWPLRRLNEHFPDEVNALIEGVMQLPLMKAFVITKKPWWQHHLEAQSYASHVPTRELHFYRVEDPDCPAANGKSGACICPAYRKPDLGMIMLYTDHPGIAYWEGLIPSDARRKLLWKTNLDKPPLDAGKEAQDFRLLDFLVRRLLAKPHPGLPGTINAERAEFFKKLRNPRLRKRLEAKPHALLGLSQQIVELLKEIEEKLPTTKKLADTNEYTAIDQALRGTLKQHPPNWLEALRRAREFREDGMITRSVVSQEARHVVAYGIRDWSAEPFGGAAHVWMPGFSADKADKLFAFALRERGDPRAHIDNVHICGEAYSGHQGFIEGALRTAECAVASIVGKLPELPKPDPWSEGGRETKEFHERRKAALSKKWKCRQRK